MSQERDRLKMLRVSPRWIVQTIQALQRGERVNLHGMDARLPADATAAGVYLDERTGTIGILVHSSTFDPVPPEQRIPDLAPAFRDQLVSVGVEPQAWPDRFEA